jgi:hypothetical protein
LLTASRQLAANVGNNTGMCCARFLANVFGNSVSKWAIMDRTELVIDALCVGCGASATKLTQLASASTLANMASAVGEKKTNVKFLALADTMLDKFGSLISQVTDSDVLYRLAVALGCLSLVNAEKKAKARAICASIASPPPNVQAVISDINL